MRHSAEVAARMRVHAPSQQFGNITKAIVFLAAPWGVPNLSKGASQYAPGIREYIKTSVQAAFGDIPVSFYTSADALVYGSHALGKDRDTLTVALRGEIVELLLLNKAGAKAYGTVPQGARSVLRTLQSHGTLSEHEARSMMVLTKHADDFYYEPLLAAGRHLSDTFAEAAEQLLSAGDATSLVVVGEQPAGEWFAKHIADNPFISELFNQDATVEALLPFHIAGRVEQGNVQDPFILLEALFVNHI